ncbi:MAG: NAD(P)(+) transhydrogenase (Re/Si-specific) subunit beta, partial [Actinomycetota bacterium]
MTSELEIGLYIFILAGFLGYHVIRGVPPLLHTPLMSATNAMSGISLIGSLLVAGAGHGPLSTAFGFVAVACSSTNVVGGFLITDRMLRMFKQEENRQREGRGLRRALPVSAVLIALVLAAGYWFSTLEGELGREELTSVLRYSYILSAVLFILGLKGLSHPRFARRGMFLAEFGMAMAVLGTLFHPDIVTYRWIALGLVIGSVVGGSMGLWVPMTAVPQRTALSHSLGALAATLIGVSEFVRHAGELGRVLMTAIGFEVVIGGLTFTGSLMAAGKLQGLLPGAPITYRGQNQSN